LFRQWRGQPRTRPPDILSSPQFKCGDLDAERSRHCLSMANSQILAETDRLGQSELDPQAFLVLPGLAAELVRLNVEVIVAVGTLGPLAAKRATSTIPIVMTAAGDPLASGLVATEWGSVVSLHGSNGDARMSS
jgi:hypothetical protein